MKHIAITNQLRRNIFFIQAKTDRGIDCYYYLLVKLSKVAQFEEIPSEMEVNLDEYGTVLHKGYGEPSAKVKKMMLDQYGFE